MTGKATAIAHGAATIVNAIALGKGAAFGVDLWTKAEVKITDEPHVIKAEITSDSTETTVLIEKTVKRVLERFGLEKSFGAKVKTWSNIPIAKGLKKQQCSLKRGSSRSNGGSRQNARWLEIVKLGVEAAFDAKVTVTGAFDDACASYFGGVVITDNLNCELVKQLPLTEDLSVLFHVPARKSLHGRLRRDEAPNGKVAR